MNNHITRDQRTAVAETLKLHLDYKEVASYLSIPPLTVKRIRDKIDRGEGPYRKVRIVTPNYTPEIRAFCAAKLAENNRMIMKQLTELVNTHLGKNFSVRSITRWVKQDDFTVKRPTVIPEERNSERVIEKR